MNKQKTLIFSLSAILFLALSFIAYSWTEPTTMPSSYNPPINTSSIAQTKTGEIGASMFRDADNSNYYINPSGNSAVSGTISGGNPVGNSDFATKTYVDSLLAGVEEEVSSSNMIYIAGSTNPPCPDNAIEISRPSVDSVICARLDELLYGNEHTAAQCRLWDGEVVTVEEGIKICRLNAAVCPGSFTQYKNWSTTTADSVSRTNQAYGDSSPVTCSCSTGSHAWGNVAREGCQTTQGCYYGASSGKYKITRCGDSNCTDFTCTFAYDGSSTSITLLGINYYCWYLCAKAIVNQIGCY